MKPSKKTNKDKTAILILGLLFLYVKTY